MFSIYSSAFNLIKNKFNYESAISNFSDFADEVVLSVNTSEDDTLDKLIQLSKDFPKLKIVSSDFSYSDPLLDGKIKNFALQSTTQEFKIGLDMDEYIPLWQKSIWEDLAYSLRFDGVSAIMIPSLNLFKDKSHYSSVTRKWYLHKSGCFRGAVNFARKADGTIDTSKSDTCELIDKDGNLVSFRSISPEIEEMRKGTVPFVVHTGYLSLENRVIRNKNFWGDHWKVESGGEAPAHKVHLDVNEFTEKCFEHHLEIGGV